MLNHHAVETSSPVASLIQAIRHLDQTHANVKLIQDGTKGPTVLLLQEALATLEYLPLNSHPSQSSPKSGIPATNWTWKYKNVPASLRVLWQPGVSTAMTQGAIMAFEENNHLATDGIAGPLVWGALLRDLRGNIKNPSGYAYISVSEMRPESLQLWKDGKVLVKTKANTGIAASPTPHGTWPIYLRYQSQTMSGTTPSGSYYSDPGVPWVSYFYQGDAVHGFVRQSYGWPQSLGCVELPVPAAKTVWNSVGIGTLVTME